MSASHMLFKNKNKVIFIMGATATGKSRLSIEMASRFPAQIINSDKIQVYRGLDIVTNKVSEREMNSVPHHLIGVVDDPDSDFTYTHFRREAMSAIQKINGLGQVAIVVGGSNSFIEALVEDPSLKFKSKYDCFFIWMDVSLPVLFAYIGKRVDQMVEAGLVEEVRRIFSPEADYDRGIRRAIGVPELDGYFRSEKTGKVDDKNRESVLASAIHEIKENTCKLAFRQIGKIRRLREDRGWKIHRVDATAVFEARSAEETEIAWKGSVLRPCMERVTEFLYG